MSALPAKELTTKQVQGVRFGFYTDDEVKRLSVKRIVSPLIFDNLKNPVADGLYDPALGPIDLRGCCTTCNLTSNFCPGHFGHIDLPLPVYNPMVFGTMHRLLKNTCFNCFHFRLSRDEMERFVRKLAYLMEGDLVGAVSVSLSKGVVGKDLADLVNDSAGGEAKGSAGGRPRAGARKSGGKVLLTSTTLQAIREVVQEFFARVPKTKCANCGANSPNVKKQGFTKLFKVWPSTKALVQNQLRGISIKSVLDQPEAEEAIHDLEAGMAEEMEEKQQRLKERKRARTEADEDGKEDVVQGYKEEGAGKEDEDEAMDDDEGPGLAGMDQAAARASVDKMDLQPKYMTPLEVEEIMRRLWQHEAHLLNLVYSAEMAAVTLKQGAQAGLSKAAVGSSRAPDYEGYRMFFVRTLLVAPNKFRPPSRVGEQLYEHAQNVTLAKILNISLELTTIQKEGQAADGGAGGTLNISRYVNLWLSLQNFVCALMDSTAADKTDQQGIRQVLEKKEGLFRKNMMGKRVNFAARSVISPDPYIGAGEIGVPPYFAKRLSFPERVTPWNVERLREAVIRGPDELPGAVAVEDERGRLVLLSHLNPQKREAVAKQLLSGSTPGATMGAGSRGRVTAATASAAVGAAGPGKIVYRHLRDGDLMLTNRQPTLHKPGLMAHRARVLKGERTIRMHYANCSTFNADFDGDEINLHLPQDQMGRAEGYNIVHADNQYIVPTDGKPIRGLIQDHVCSATLLTSRDAFFNKGEYMQLVYVACTPWLANKGPGAHPMTEPIELEPPTMLKPRVMWTGKQVVSTVLRFFTRGLPPLTFSGKTKVPADYWGSKDSGEGEMLFRKGYLVTGILDKNQFAKYGLVHAVQELYGNVAAGQLLNAFSRLFTHYLQWFGLTCGYDDLLLLSDAEQRRAKLLSGAEAIAIGASAEFVGQQLPGGLVANARTRQADLVKAEEPVVTALAERYRSNADTGKAHDMKGSGVMHKLSSQVVGTCLPAGQAKAFPRNCLSLMTVTGAKGSMVNFSQISCLLGQQELEGRRPPRMSSGKTLPCFRPFDAGARSCGFVGDRFLTGLRPQEYYFHCMAGREGLVDTAVKTSRSGYLQRCLVKNLETLRVHYDGTVRDNSDGSVVQLLYGEDGLDVLNVSYMQQYEFLARNAQRFAQQLDLAGALSVSKVAGLKAMEKEVRHRLADRAELQQALAAAPAGKQKAALLAKLSAEVPLMANYPTSALGSTSEKFADQLQTYLSRNPQGVLYKGEAGGQLGKLGEKPEVEAETFQRLMQLKFMRSQAAAGEAVGVLAAQSVGEPSTQMTLNTFHMAGRGEANVTLGIPRLREILMTAAANIKTPVMTLHLNPGLGLPSAQTLANRMRKLRLAECLAGITVEETPVARVQGMEGGFGRMYKVVLQFFEPSKYPKEAELSFEEIVDCFYASFCPRLRTEIEKQAKKRAGGLSIGRIDMSSLGDEEQAPNAAPGVDDGDGAGAGGKKAKKKSEKDDDFEDAEEDEELREGKLRFRGGRGEAATYDAPDDEEADIAKQAERAATRAEFGEDDEDEEQEAGATARDGNEEGNQEPATTAAAVSSKAKRQARNKAHSASKDQDNSIDYQAHTCSVTVTLPLHSPKLLMLEVVEHVAATTMVRITDHIDKVYVVEGQNGEDPKVQTDGINFIGAWQSADLVDVNRILTNDVAAMLRTYGVEAARATIMHEVSSVFNAYGIGVDPRHLCLIADFMTHQGGYRAMSRIGIESSVSPFLKMSFETATHFLTDATLKGSTDNLKSPSARLCVGRVVDMGTGAVELIHNL